MNAIQRWYFLQYDHEPYQAPIGDSGQELWCKAKDVAELERLVYQYVGTIANLRANVHEAREIAHKVYDQLPDGMKQCTIKFVECDLGHSWLTATNWVQHGCPTCEINDLKDQLRQVDDRGVL